MQNTFLHVAHGASSSYTSLHRSQVEDMHNGEAGVTTSLFLGARVWGNPQIPNQALAMVPGPSNQAAVRRELYFLQGKGSYDGEREKEGRKNVGIGIASTPLAVPRTPTRLWVKAGMSRCQLRKVTSPQ